MTMTFTREKLMQVLDRNFKHAGIRITVRRYNKILEELGFELLERPKPNLKQKKIIILVVE